MKGRSAHKSGRGVKNALGAGIQGLSQATNKGGHHAGEAPPAEPKKRGGSMDGKGGKRRLDRHGGHVGSGAKGGGAESHPYSGAASGHYRRGGSVRGKSC